MAWPCQLPRAWPIEQSNPWNVYQIIEFVLDKVHAGFKELLVALFALMTRVESPTIAKLSYRYSVHSLQNPESIHIFHWGKTLFRMPSWVSLYESINRCGETVARTCHLVRDGHLNLASTIFVKAHLICLIGGSLEMSTCWKSRCKNLSCSGLFSITSLCERY